MRRRVIRRLPGAVACLVATLGCQLDVRADVPGLDELRREWASLLDDWHPKMQLDGYPFMDCFRQAAQESRVELPLLVGLAWGESAFDPRARSDKNAIGVMQIRWPLTARELGFASIEELEEPCRNIRAGARYLRQLLDRSRGDTLLALASYNHGPTAIAADDRNVNDHARWYVRYVYDKTSRVMDGRRFRAVDLSLRLGRFTDYEMARTSLVHYRRKVRMYEQTELELSIQRGTEGKYEMRVACGSPEAKRAELARYERITGFRPN